MADETAAVVPIGHELESARALFGERYHLAVSYTEKLATEGKLRGVIGPSELGRLWGRHLLNSAALSELLPQHCGVLDVGSGAGLPGVPLAIARPDLRLTLLEPLARRVAWLNEVVTELGLDVQVVRGRAEEPAVRKEFAGQDAVIARAVAPMGRLAEWCIPLLRQGGVLLAVKGATVHDEVERDHSVISSLGGIKQKVVLCGVDVLETATTVAVVERGVMKRETRNVRKQRKGR